MTAAGRIALDGLRLLKARLGDSSLPWGGRSSRVLTRAHKRFRLELCSDDADPDFDEELVDEQYRRFLDEERERGGFE